MTPPDDEFDDFLRKRRPLFGRDDDLEPPLELDRAVLRQAREAIEGEQRPQRIFRTPSWGMPVALAATLVLAFTIILRVDTRQGEPARKGTVTVENVARRVEMRDAAEPLVAPAPQVARVAPAAAPPPTADESDAVVVDLAAASPMAEAQSAAEEKGPARHAERLAGAANSPPEYRRSSKAWLAEIDRLRAVGDSARADAELTEYKREHRAYAGAPDR
jgi:hypothetical protein